jgi:hypothetical protein
MRHFPLLILSVTLLVPVQAGAQSLAPPKARDSSAQKVVREPAVPKQYLPPAGMCRIWVNNVPAARQPAPTSCETAIRNRPPNARILFPPDRPTDSKKSAPVRPRPDTTKRKPPA